MMIYYGKAGWYANIALAINFLFGILASLGCFNFARYCRYCFNDGNCCRCKYYYERKEELRAVKRWRKQLKHPIAGECYVINYRCECYTF
jgi:SecD/SecF fusion protein